jgi:DNA gyrase subunit A
MAAISSEICQELTQQTVPFRPSYDGTKSEPVVLPSRVPTLLVNGATGIAVGMATNIPPHNLKEVCNALVKLLENPELNTYQLIANDAVQGPDFPTGGEVLNTREELREIYKNGQGSIRLRAKWELGEETRSTKTLYITEIPYAVNKSTLVEAIAQVVIQRKLPPLLDIKDVSTEDVRIALELKKDADEQKVLAYLFKHTPLQTNFNINLTCLIPTENPEVGRPERCDLREILQCFLNFRMEVVTKRLEHELKQLLKRIHILDGFALVFDALDEIIKIIRASDGKADAARKIMARFDQLDEEQTEAILELKLYRLAKLEINLIRDELAEKRKRVGEIEKLLEETDADGIWDIVKNELIEIRDKYGKKDKRRTTFAGEQAEVEYVEEDFIIDEDNYFLVTRDGWVKRQKNPIDLEKVRLREGDSVLKASAGSTRATVVFFSNMGVAYTARIIDLPATTGYGEPIQKFFKLKDGETILSAISLDERVIGNISAEGEAVPEIHAIAASTDGYAIRFSLAPFAEPSTRAGRKFARPAKDVQMVGVYAIAGDETLIAATFRARALLCNADEINFVSGPAKGVQLIKVGKDDYIMGFVTAVDDRDTMTVKTSMGGEQRLNTGKYERTTRGGKGREILKRGTFTRMVPPELKIIEL